MFNIQQKTSCPSVTESESADTDQLCSGSEIRYDGKMSFKIILHLVF